MTFLVVHHNGISDNLLVEYGDRAGAESAAEFLVATQGGTAKVFAAFELRSFCHRRDLEPDPAQFADALDYIESAVAADVHSSDVEPRS